MDFVIQNQDSGEKDFGVSVSPNRGLSLWNSLKDLSTEGFEQCLADSEWQDIKQKLSLSRQREKARRTSVTGSSLLPTPTTYAKGSGKHRPAGSNKLETRLKPFLEGGKLNPAVVGWMMGFPPGWVEDILMDGGQKIQLPSIPLGLATFSTVVPAATSTASPSLHNKPRSYSNGFFTLAPSSPSKKSPKKKLEQEPFFLGETVEEQSPQASSIPFLGENDSNPLKTASRISPKKNEAGEKRAPLPKSPKKNPSGYLGPVLQRKRSKDGRVTEYPKVEGERVPIALAWEYPHQFLWIYNYSVKTEEGHWKTKSKSVPRDRIWSVRSAIASNQPVEQILKLIEKGKGRKA